MSNEKCIVLCSDDSCRFCSGGGYYGICKHPANVDKEIYCGIDRYYMSTCKLKEIEQHENIAGRISCNGVDITKFVVGDMNIDKTREGEHYEKMG